MKKFLSILTTAICITVCAFSFAACGDNTGDNTHTSHNWSTTYTQDGDRHYQTCDGCDEKKYSDHDYGTDGVCVCGKTKSEMPFSEFLATHKDKAIGFVSEYIRPSVIGEGKEVKAESWSISTNADNKIDKVSILYVYGTSVSARTVELATVTLTTPVSINAIVNGDVQSVSTSVDRKTVFEFDAQYNYENQAIINALYQSQNKPSDLKLISETEAAFDSNYAYNYIEVKDGKIDAYNLEVRRGDGSVENVIANFQNGRTTKPQVLGSYSTVGTVIKTGEYAYEDAVIYVESVTLDESKITLEIGSMQTLTATVSPADATDKSVAWSSDHPEIATVDESGKVTAVAAGTAVITATAANNKTATCTVTVNAPLTNAEVLDYLNDNILLKAARSCITSFLEVNVNNVQADTWYITKDGKNITSANLVFTYLSAANSHTKTLCKIDFTSPLTTQNIKSNETVTPTYTKVYQNIINPQIQEEHTALTNAICDKLFGENTTATRYIIDNGHHSLDDLGPGFVGANYYTVIEITDAAIKENSIAIRYENNDTALIANLKDATKYRINGGEKSYAIMGEKLENNDDAFDWTTGQTPLGDKVTNEQLKTVLNAGYREKAIRLCLDIQNNGTVDYSKISDENWYVTKDKNGNIIDATLTFYRKNGTQTYYGRTKLTFCTAPFAYEDYLNAQKGIYKEVVCTDKDRDSKLIEDTATVNLYPNTVAAILTKQNITLTETARISYVRRSDNTTKGSLTINGVVSDADYTLRLFVVYILDGVNLTAVNVYINDASSDAGYAANVNNDLFKTYGASSDWYTGTHSLIPDGERL